MQIRLAQLEDVVAIAHVLTLSFYPRSGWLRPLWQWGIALDLRWRLHEPAPRYACLVAISEQAQAIATIEICTRSFRPWQTLQYPYIFNLAVHPDWRRRGIARQLLQGVEPYAKEWGFSQIFIHVTAKNQSAHQLYQQANYCLYRHDRSWHSPQRLLLRKNL